MRALSEVTIKSLLESGAHFGHQKHRWNPKMKRFIFEERNGLYIIDLAKTLQQIRSAAEVVRKVVAAKKSILFVGTKKQAKAVIKESAEECNEFYICERWLGGMLTNLKTIRESVKRLDLVEKKLVTDAERMTKKEFSMLSKTQEKLNSNLSGIRTMRKLPGLVIVVDPSREQIAIAEARKLGIPIMALVDTNCDPDLVDYVIACNDDALKCVKLIIQSLATAITEMKKELGIVKPQSVEVPEVKANKEPDQSGDEG
ncbi:MAG: 30S ribosomal protein S2 [Chlamydiae bacterium]|nr:30S ribosomal protein S2 [Chlamydiota bacterium]